MFAYGDETTRKRPPTNDTAASEGPSAPPIARVSRLSRLIDLPLISAINFDTEPRINGSYGKLVSSEMLDSDESFPVQSQ